MSIFTAIAEQRIEQARDRGELDNIPGAGKPLPLDDDTLVPPENRMAFRLLKNSGYLPQEVADRREIRSILDMLEYCEDERTRYQCMRRLDVLRAKTGASSPLLDDDSPYYRKLVDRMSE